VVADDPGDDVGEISVGSTPMSLQISISEVMRAQYLQPPTELANSSFLRFRAIDDVGIDLDAIVGNEAHQHVPTRQRISDRFREFGLLADQTKPGTLPGSNSSTICWLFSWRAARRLSAVQPQISRLR
jgi:hypothetical protein